VKTHFYFQRSDAQNSEYSTDIEKLQVILLTYTLQYNNDNKNNHFLSHYRHTCQPVLAGIIKKTVNFVLCNISTCLKVQYRPQSFDEAAGDKLNVAAGLICMKLA